MNYFYAPKEDWHKEHSVELKGQEAQHIVKVLRYKTGDHINVADGQGHHFRCEITELSKQSVLARVVEGDFKHEPSQKKVLALGSIKKRDRLEYAVEKAVELGAWEICIFDADHSERSRINEERIKTQIISAFKQSGRHYLPELVILDSLDQVIKQYRDHKPIMAYLGDRESETKVDLIHHNLLLVGPEGGFSEREAGVVANNSGSFISLGELRLRAETAVTALLSQYLNSQ